MAKRKHQSYIKGTATHRRTEGDYMAILLETVTLEDWQDAVNNALTTAKQGDAQARSLAGAIFGRQASRQGTHAIDGSGAAIERG